MPMGSLLPTTLETRGRLAIPLRRPPIAPPRRAPFWGLGEALRLGLALAAGMAVPVVRATRAMMVRREKCIVTKAGW